MPHADNIMNDFKDTCIFMKKLYSVCKYSSTFTEIN